jgi:hypothetical protein
VGNDNHDPDGPEVGRMAWTQPVEHWLRRLLRSHPIPTRVIGSTMILVCLLMAVECAFRVVSKVEGNTNNLNSHLGKFYGEFHVFDARLGFVPPKNRCFRHLLMGPNGPIYDVTYTLDKCGRRVTPVAAGPGRNRFLLFFGCSFTFGEGVNDDECMPAQVDRLTSDYVTYNYGLPGYGPQQTLVKLEDPDFLAEVNEKNGILIYTFISSHVNRAVGSMTVFTQWEEHFPFYEITDDDQLDLRGDFSSGRPVKNFIYRLLGKSRTLNHFKFDWPLYYGPRDWALTARILGEAKKKFNTLFPNCPFYVLIFPGFCSPQMIPLFQQYGIRVLDYSKMYDFTQPRFWLTGNGHPSPQGYSSVAARLVRDLGIAKHPERSRP